MDNTTLVDGRYALSRILGEGGMATVYLAHDERLDRPLALKMLKDYYAGSREFLARFELEARSAASLSHPNIVSVYDHRLSESGRYYIAMEYLPGGTLAELLHRAGPLEPHEAAGVARQIALALDAAHQHGIVHRDIKPHNVFLATDARGVVKVGDFGIARAVNAFADGGSTSALTQPSLILGTARYISPEQARAEPATPASDLYSLGVTLYETLTGQVPFHGTEGGPLGLAMRHVNERPLPPEALNDAIPPDLSRVVMRLLAKDPKDRYAGDALTLADDLERLSGGRPLQSAAAPPPPRHAPGAPRAATTAPTRRFAPAPGTGDPALAGRRPGSKSPPTRPSPPPRPRRPRGRGLRRLLARGLLLLAALGTIAYYSYAVGQPSAQGVSQSPLPGGLPQSAGALLHDLLPNAAGSSDNTSQDDVKPAVEEYYRAVDRQDWAYTYANLSSASRAMFASQDDWAARNRLVSGNPPLKLASMDVAVGQTTTDASGDLEAQVTVNRTFADGSAFPRQTSFVREGGAWRHQLSDEEMAMFAPGGAPSPG